MSAAAPAVQLHSWPGWEGPHTHSAGTGPGLRPSWRPWGQGRAGPGERKDGGEGREGGAGGWTATERAGWVLDPGTVTREGGPLLPPQGPEAPRLRLGWSRRGGSCTQPQGPGRGGRSLASWSSGGSCAHFWKWLRRATERSGWDMAAGNCCQVKARLSSRTQTLETPMPRPQDIDGQGPRPWALGLSSAAPPCVWFGDLQWNSLVWVSRVVLFVCLF